jgi:predicted dehydrogenase
MAVQPVKIGVFGYGFIAGVHVEALQHCQGAEVVAVCGPRPEAARAFAAKYQVPHVFTDPAQMLAMPEITGVLVDTPDATHHPLVLASVRAGKHIFCEKPLARTVQEAREMYQAARVANLRTLVGFSNRWNTVVRNMRAMIESDEIGEIAHVHSQSLNPSLLRTPKPRFTWRTDAARTGTGIVGDLGSHHIDLTHYLVGDIVEVCADLKTFIKEVYDEQGKPHPHLVDDDSILLVQLANGAHGTISQSKLGSVHSDFPIGRRHYMINGRKGGILFENGQAWLYRPDQKGIPIPGDPPMVDKGHAGQLLTGAIRQMETFLQSIREDRDIAPTFAEGLKCQEVLHAAVESSKSHTWIKVQRVQE